MKIFALKNLLFVLHKWSAEDEKVNFIKISEVAMSLLFGLHIIRNSLPNLLDDINIRAVLSFKTKDYGILIYTCYYMLYYDNLIAKKKIIAIYQGYLADRKSVV